MVVCPKCSTNIDADFGIQRCPSCSSNVIIELDGTARTEEGAAPEGVRAEAELVPDFLAPAPAPEAAPLFEEPADDPPPIMLDPPPAILKPRSPPRNEADLSDIAAFGNSDASMARDGIYIYDLLIWNVDSRDTKEQLRGALTDARFAWDVEKIMSSIQQGAMRINSINAVKSALLVNRIKNLPIGISWEQKLITDMGMA
ncbi:MAG: hypothetical protein SGJ18_07865 [Pseudomonadota bacterium]|nr:hypothetical protein [Pseudomonadota bacterium]